MIETIDDNFLLMGGRAAGGSLKHVLMDKLLPDDLPGGSLVADLSAGLAALALAHVAERRGLRCRVYVPAFIPERYLTDLHRTAAEVVICQEMKGALEELQQAHQAQELFWTRQNYQECDAYAHLVPPLVPDHLVAGVGTGCALRSFGAHLKGKNALLQVHAVYAAVPGLRPPQMHMDLPEYTDVGSLQFLHQRFGEGLQVHTVEASDSTEAVLQVMKSLHNALGISVDRA